jgi:hypothetical protein
MSSRWSTGWVILPGTSKTPGEHLHRPHPDRRESSLCDRVVSGRPVYPMGSGFLPADLPACVRCEVKASRGKARDHRREKQAEADRKWAEERRDKARREKYGAYQPGSVRAYGAGLPGLGRRR